MIATARPVHDGPSASTIRDRPILLLVHHSGRCVAAARPGPSSLQMKPGTRQAPIETCATRPTRRDIISDRTELQKQRPTDGWRRRTAARRVADDNRSPSRSRCAVQQTRSENLLQQFDFCACQTSVAGIKIALGIKFLFALPNAICTNVNRLLPCVAHKPGCKSILVV